MGQALRRLGRQHAEARLQPGCVELGRGQQRAQLIVQVARQPAAFVFAGGLQVLRQLGELQGALSHLQLQAVGFGLQLAPLLGSNVVEHIRLPQVHEQGQQADGGHGRDTDAVQHQGVVHVLAAGGDSDRLERQQLLAQYADRLHLLAADVGHHQRDRRFRLAFIEHADGLFQLRQSSRHQGAHLRAQLGAIRVVGVVLLQRIHRLLDFVQRFQIGLEIVFALGQQVAALARFSVDHVTQQALNVDACLGHRAHLVQRDDRLAIRRLADGDHGQRGQRRQRQGKGAALDA